MPFESPTRALHDLNPFPSYHGLWIPCTLPLFPSSIPRVGSTLDRMKPSRCNRLFTLSDVAFSGAKMGFFFNVSIRGRLNLRLTSSGTVSRCLTGSNFLAVKTDEWVYNEAHTYTHTHVLYLLPVNRQIQRDCFSLLVPHPHPHPPRLHLGR